MGTLLFSIIFLATIIILLYLGKNSNWNLRYFLYIIMSLLGTLDLIYINFFGFYFLEFIISFIFISSLLFIIYIMSLSIKDKKKIVFLSFIDLMLLLITSLPLILKSYLNLKSFSKECIISILQTNISETYNFIITTTSSYHIIITISLFLATSLIINIQKNAISNSNKKGLFIIFILFSSNIIISGLKCSSIDFIIKTKESYDQYIKVMNHDEHHLNYSNFYLTNKDSINLVIIIGESLCRDYMSSYGYSFKTTPQIDRFVRDSIFLLYPNVYSNNIKTIKCIPDILTSQNQFNPNSQYNLINLLNYLGFHTAWLSNQSQIGLYDSPITSLVKNAKVQRYKKIGKEYDETLIRDLKIELSNLKEKQVIFLQLMGQHLHASSQYPHTRPFLRDTTYQDNYLYHYENSIIYNDHVISSIYKEINNLSNTILIYLSDHGEKPGLSRFEENPHIQMFRIPLLIYFSPDLKHSSTYTSLLNNINKFWSNDLFFELACGILGIKNDSIIKEQYDLSSTKYNLEASKFSFISNKYHLTETGNEFK